MRRRLPPLVGERDRFAAAALAVDRLQRFMQKRQPGWHHYADSAATLYSVKPEAH